ncbi:MAG: radical SAM protein [Opitutales bacterium]|nr:radical SAM protein [Opitutales bacterium]
MAELLKIHSAETSGASGGSGKRYVLFFHGCPFKCRFCRTPDICNSENFSLRSVDEIVADVLKYESFLNFSSGGFTASGGEPTLQAEGLLELFKRLKGNAVSTALDTCGYVDLSLKIKELLDFTDLVLLGIKHLDPQKHLALTGRDNRKVFEFLEYLNLIKKPTRLKIVLLEGVSLGGGYAEALADFASKYRCIERVELLPYRGGAAQGAGRRKTSLRLQDLRLPSRASIKKFREALEAKGLEVVCGD